ncbi:OB-fold domain-containing protein [Sphingobium sufflavum]|uniref:Zn-ribbon domain-containing OB-fold protein n=1 Tax=Sphingobium sufflavum TaxID=1129547 RepID=UPI001F2272A4|nr:zinc ribbon domain-containing protein [Sphingobium sufflavum]MCE7795224.1 OB-fold domain-containing protein [Sphingobium sufflavum]
MPEASTEARPEPKRQLPLLEPETAFFWTGGANGQLLIQQCAACGTYQHPPLPRCRACHSADVAPVAVSGRGRIATYTVNREAWLPGLKVPFVYAAVELEEQSQLYVFANILGLVEAVRIGLAVTVTFEQHEDVWLPMFEIHDDR